jgi:hypothetical protein
VNIAIKLERPTGLAPALGNAYFRPVVMDDGGEGRRSTGSLSLRACRSPAALMSAIDAPGSARKGTCGIRS